METIYRTAAAPWDLSDNRGNHRVVVTVSEPGEYVHIKVHWRRRDEYPERCGIMARRISDDRAVNIKAVCVTREAGEFVLEAPEAGEYAIYYMPCRRLGDSWWNPVMDYAKEAFPGCDSVWEENIPQDMPEGKVIAIESRTEFDSFYPMELPATPDETKNLLEMAGNVPFVLFPEDREFPVRMLYELPYRWIERGLTNEFNGTARPDEYYVFQLAVLARENLDDIYVEYHGDSAEITCFNRDGVDWLGHPFTKKLRCDKGRIQPLWFGVQVPCQTGQIDFEVTVSANGYSCTVPVHIKIEGEPIANHGDGDLWRLSRLRWLNSTIGLDDEPAKPYTPVHREGDTVFCLGRSVKLSENGLPARIDSYFDGSIHIGDKALPILRAPVEFSVSDERGRIAFSGFESRTVCEKSGACELETTGRSDGLSIKTNNRLEYDGHMETFVTLSAEKDTELTDISLNLSLTPECSRYMMGMGREGGISPESWAYHWDESRANNFVWIGGVNGGLNLKLKHTEEVWEIYNYQKTGLPDSWANNGKGGCRIEFGEDGANLRAYSGSRTLKAGESVIFRYSLQITPLKEIDSDAHWRDRYDHPGDKGIDLESTKAGGATVVNLHQGRAENPYINYPFCKDDVLKPIIRQAHAMGIKYKLYYTVRELTTHAQEFFAVRSLGDEILLDGPTFRIAEHFKEDFFKQNKSAKSTGGPWLCEHLPEGYTPAWQTIFPDGDYDCSVATVGLSRWHNYYLDGLSWLMRETGADGIYLDGVGYDRQIMKRMRKVLDQSKDGCLIDFHSGNNFHPNYGLCNVLGQYMELLPSVDSLWIGEGFDYERTKPDYWLVEISGIPFGLMGDMLHRGGNKWRGMVFGMTPRCNWPEGGSPLPIWQLWESFGMNGCVMRGWWDEECPVHPLNPECKATAYVQEDRMLISVASWADETVETSLDIRLPEGWDAGKVRYSIPFIENFQDEQDFEPDSRLSIAPARGKILIIEKNA
ncbi:MAG: glycoside hydrolase domain-containing protein [Eubacteriales bacterium]